MTSARAVLGVAVLVTVGLLAGLGRGSAMAAAYAGLVGNLVVPALWSAAVMIRPRRREVATAVGLAAVLLLALAGWRDGTVGGCFVVAGVAGGWALRRGWRVLPILGVVASLLAPVMILELGGTSLVEATEALNVENRRAFDENLPAGLSASDREAALAEFDAVAGRMLAVQRRLWPGLVVIGLMSQAALALSLGWLIARLVVPRPPRPALRRWEDWRAPFFSVWTLIGGLAAVVTGNPSLVMAGWNLVLLAGLLLAVQGLAVQSWLVRRLLPPTLRALFWILGALFLAPLLVGGGVLIGLADQWLNLRRSHDPGATQGDDET
ncbi:MAG: DUF2232 domain-containing protein [Candidatus Krumholzibacteriia bacterium]